MDYANHGSCQPWIFSLSAVNHALALHMMYQASYFRNSGGRSFSPTARILPACFFPPPLGHREGIGQHCFPRREFQPRPGASHSRWSGIYCWRCEADGTRDNSSSRSSRSSSNSSNSSNSSSSSSMFVSPMQSALTPGQYGYMVFMS